MNCKPGDLAITVGMISPENNGVIVEVIKPSYLRGGWFVRSYRPVVCWRGCYDTDFSVHDDNLRPISGLPLNEETHDEVTA